MMFNILHDQNCLKLLTPVAIRTFANRYLSAIGGGSSCNALLDGRNLQRKHITMIS